MFSDRLDGSQNAKQATALIAVVANRVLSLPYRSAINPMTILPIALHALLMAIKFAPAVEENPRVRAYVEKKKMGV
jgi:hypothetical protein